MQISMHIFSLLYTITFFIRKFHLVNHSVVEDPEYIAYKIIQHFVYVYISCISK